jgi:2-isopropylmalate synthase
MTDVLRLVRWTCSTGSAAQSRAAVVVELGPARREASAEGNGPVDAVFRAVDAALRDLVPGPPRLLAYDVHALGEGTDAVARVSVRVAAAPAGDAPPVEERGEAESTNLVAASVDAYVAALARLLETARGGAEAASGHGSESAPAEPPRAEFDPDADVDVFGWFER